MKNLLPAMLLAPAMSLQVMAVENKDFNYHVDNFADIEVLRYEVPEFNT